VVARLHIGLAWLSAAAACVGCSTLLGLDPPELAACLEGTCADAQATFGDAATGDDDGAAVPDATEAADAPVEAGLRDAASAQPPNTFRCGGGGVGFPPTLYCRNTAEICCQTNDDAGNVEFACVGSRSACSGYPIGCANENDCTLNNICCYYASGIKCEPPAGTAATCPMGAQTGTQACDPKDINECPQGQSCTARLMNGSIALPYIGCN
jgi:hypothetical protein